MSKRAKKLFSIKGKGKLEKRDNVVVDKSYRFNATTTNSGMLTFQSGTSRDIRKAYELQGFSKSQVISHVATLKTPFEKSPLFEALRTKKGYSVNVKGEVINYSYEDAIHNLRLNPIRKAISETFNAERKLLNDLKKKTEK